MKNISVFCGSHLAQNVAFAWAAKEMGRLIARRGDILIYGGSNLGYMGEVSSAALQEGGKVVGIIPSFFSNEIIYSQPVTELVIVDSLSERKKAMGLRSDYFIALAGGIGTIDEISEMLTYNQLGRMGCLKPIGILNTDHFYSPLLSQFELMVNEGLLSLETYHCILSASTPEELLEKLDSWTPPKDL